VHLRGGARTGAPILSSPARGAQYWTRSHKECASREAQQQRWAYLLKPDTVFAQRVLYSSGHGIEHAGHRHVSVSACPLRTHSCTYPVPKSSGYAIGHADTCRLPWVRVRKYSHQIMLRATMPDSMKIDATLQTQANGHNPFHIRPQVSPAYRLNMSAASSCRLGDVLHSRGPQHLHVHVCM
jgi:hypothetical protein